LLLSLLDFGNADRKAALVSCRIKYGWEERERGWQQCRDLTTGHTVLQIRAAQGSAGDEWNTSLAFHDHGSCVRLNARGILAIYGLHCLSRYPSGAHQQARNASDQPMRISKALKPKGVVKARKSFLVTTKH